MRSIILNLIVPILLAPSLLAATLPADSQRLEASPSRVDFGEAFEGEVLKQEVTVSNTGNTPWPVSRIQTSCGCTVASLFDPEGNAVATKPQGTDPIIVLQPGQAMRTSVEFRTQGKHGPVNQTMQVFHTDATIPALSIPVSITVSRAIDVNPRWVNLGNLGKSQKVEQVIVIEALEIGDWSIEGFASQVEGQDLPQWLSFEVLDTEGATRRVKCVIDGDLPVGALSPRVKVLIDHERIESVDFTMTGIVRPNVTFDSGQANFQENINFEQFGAGDKVTRMLAILNAAPDEPYLLEDVEVQSKQKEFFTVETVTVQEGVKYEVRLTADGAIGLPFFRGNLMLKAKHPDVPAKLIPFHGWVQN